ncbi:hypothetical protein CQ009_11615 [Pseudomonas sp. MYb2]|jgi:hypothetical protein|uniref:hypothetical protein n=1 Tax=unclassified Pseudomonas TaxID=196821 RepID=UPI000D003142|nr:MULTISPECIES: hypothetical protein [unclassified Pseudomonas]PRB50938.1 hypothetical protein CQ025_08260 [Pseudomonas sp. MYb3]PRC34317.1 hypothetical protein CQ009_11615 [Pseudomonas sp. MYb2]
MTRLQTLKLIQIALALPAYTVPASTTFVFTLWSVIAFLIAVFTSEPITGGWRVLLVLILALYSQWACWSIFADALEDAPTVRYLPLLLLGVVLSMLLGLSSWFLFHTALIWVMCGTQGIAAGVLLVINWVRKRGMGSD